MPPFPHLGVSKLWFSLGATRHHIKDEKNGYFICSSIVLAEVTLTHHDPSNAHRHRKLTEETSFAFACLAWELSEKKV